MTADVVIVGGGPIGAMAALVFKKKYPQVTLIEQRPLQSFLSLERSRTLALNFKSIKILQAFGLLDDLRAYLSPIKEVHVSVKGHLGATRIKSQALDLEMLGGVIEQHHLERVLYQKLADFDVQVIDSASITHLEPESPWKIHYQTANQKALIEAQICVACDGQFSKTREALGISVQTFDYQQTATVSILSFEAEHQSIAYEHFCEQGVVAILPMKGTLATCIWTQPPIDAQYMQRATPEVFVEQLCEQFKRLAYFKPKCLFRKEFPLQSVVSQMQATDNALLLGNAAHSLHPIAAQGLNLSLRDLHHIATQLHDKQAVLSDIFQNYTKLRKRDQDNMLKYTHLMASKMGTHQIPRWAKSLGLSLVDLIPGFKNQVSHFNLGFGL